MAKKAKGYYRSRAKYYGGRARSYARSAAQRTGLNTSMFFWGGVAAAFAIPQNTDIDMAAIMVNQFPMKGIPYQARQATGGYIFGQAAQHWLLPKVGVNIPDIGNGIIPGVTRANGFSNAVM